MNGSEAILDAIEEAKKLDRQIRLDKTARAVVAKLASGDVFNPYAHCNEAWNYAYELERLREVFMARDSGDPR